MSAGVHTCMQGCKPCQYDFKPPLATSHPVSRGSRIGMRWYESAIPWLGLGPLKPSKVWTALRMDRDPRVSGYVFLRAGPLHH